MIVRCARCESPVAEEVGVEAPGEQGPMIYCSSSCAEGVGSQPGEPAPLRRLPSTPKRIAVAVDGSGASVRAVEYAASLAVGWGAEIELVHAIDRAALRALDGLAIVPAALRMGLDPDSLAPALREDAERRISREVRICKHAGVSVSTRIAFEHPLEVVRQAADDADLVVVGSRGLGALGGVMLGSLSHRLSGVTRTPILVIH